LAREEMEAKNAAAVEKELLAPEEAKKQCEVVLKPSAPTIPGSAIISLFDISSVLLPKKNSSFRHWNEIFPSRREMAAGACRHH